MSRILIQDLYKVILPDLRMVANVKPSIKTTVTHLIPLLIEIKI